MTAQVDQKKKGLDPDEKLSLMGAWSSIGLGLILLGLTLINGVSYGNIIGHIGSLLSGHLEEIPTNGYEGSLLSVGMNIIAVALLTLPVSIIIGALTTRRSTSYDMEAMKALLAKGPWAVFLLVLIEELFTRGLFLGLLTKVFHGPIAFYVLFLVGNGLWALVHLKNFKDKAERSVLRVLPQFVAGIAFTYVFVRFGLIAAIMTHFLYNAIVLATQKEQMPSKRTWITTLYYAGFGLILFILMKLFGNGFSDLLPWLRGEVVPLAHYNFISYAVLLIVVDCVVCVVASLLFMDTNKSNLKELGKGTKSFIPKILGTVILTSAILFCANWLLSLFIADFTTRVVILTILWVLCSSTTSGSSLAQATVVGFPAAFFAVAAFSVLGFFPTFGLLLIFFLFHYIPMSLRSE